MRALTGQPVVVYETNKFKRICEICKVHKDMKILEIGFGECDFMNYIKENYGAKVIGVSISEEQVKVAKSKGYDAYHLDMWKITDKIGKFDLILQCGSLEYLRCCSESQDKYEKYFKIIQKILNKNGKYFTACLHFHPELLSRFTLYDYVMAYFLSFGNDG
jgi:cyclopropane-fatty-acyl-phospholipid synthase